MERRSLTRGCAGEEGAKRHRGGHHTMAEATGTAEMIVSRDVQSDQQRALDELMRKKQDEADWVQLQEKITRMVQEWEPSIHQFEVLPSCLISDTPPTLLSGLAGVPPDFASRTASCDPQAAPPSRPHRPRRVSVA